MVFKKHIINESLVTLSNLINDKPKYKIVIKNLNAVNSGNELKYLVVDVIMGKPHKLLDEVTALYNYTGTINGKKILFVKN